MSGVVDALLMATSLWCCALSHLEDWMRDDLEPLHKSLDAPIYVSGPVFVDYRAAVQSSRTHTPISGLCCRGIGCYAGIKVACVFCEI